MTPIPPASTWPSYERRVQKRWLYNNHLTAFAGIEPVDEILATELGEAAQASEHKPPRSLLAIGDILDVSDPKTTSSVPAIAMASGESGQTLRIARVIESKLAWVETETYEDGDIRNETTYDDAVLDLAVIDPNDKDDECLWKGDGIPISQIKFVKSLVLHDPIRYLIVQKPTSTTIMAPHYHRVPTSEGSVISSQFGRLSRIDPNVVLTLTTEQTQGRAHVDVAYNPVRYNMAAQLAIVDECGFWSVWSISGSTRRNQRAFLRITPHSHGHIEQGLLDPLAMHIAADYPILPHGVLFAGTYENDNGWSNSMLEAESGSTLRSPYVVAWSPEGFDVVDLTTRTMLQRLSYPVIGTDKHNTIFDIQSNPAHAEQLFLLTSQSILWVEIAAAGLASKPALLLECPHLAPRGDSLKMSLTMSSPEEDDTVLLFLYEPGAEQMTVNWFGTSGETKVRQWQRQVIPAPKIPIEGQSSQQILQLQTMLFRAAKLSLTEQDESTGPGSALSQQGVLLHQGLLMTEDLSLRYCISRISLNPGLQVPLPTKRLHWSEWSQIRRWKRKRKAFLRFMEDAFVLPDGMEPVDIRYLVHRNAALTDHSQEKSAVVPPKIRRKVLNIEPLLNAIGARLEIRELPEVPGLPASLANVLGQAVEDGVANVNLPLTTCQDIVARRCQPGTWAPAETVERAIANLKDDFEGELVMPEFRLRQPDELSGHRASLEDVHRQLSELRLRPMEGVAEDGQWEPYISITDLASRAYLSIQGIVIEDTPLFESSSTAAADEVDPWVSSSQPPKSPRSPATIQSSSPPPQAIPEPNDRCIQRLQLLASDIRPGKLGRKKKASILSRWPEERGVDPTDYVSTVTEASERRFDEARQRLKRREGRRKPQSSGSKPPSSGPSSSRPPFMRQGFPEADRTASIRAARSSPQPAQSSQTQANTQTQSQIPAIGSLVTMSQPVVGAFGDRKKAKKVKRKSGFR